MAVEVDLIDALSHLELSGNVRELKNLIATALAVKTDPNPLGLQDLPSQIWRQLSGTDFTGAAPCASPPGSKNGGVENSLSPAHAFASSLIEREGWNLDRCLSHCEREIVEAAMQHTRNNQSQAARLLGVTPRSIYNKLRRYELLNKPPL